MDSGSSDEKTTTTPPNQPTPASSTPTTTTHTDDESSSLTTSTESELLGTWTLVTDKAKLKLANEADAEKTQELSPELKKAIDEAAAVTRMEELPDSPDDLEDGGFEEDDTKESKADTTLDDFSDGISIISESDSGGRLSPHPFMRAHLQDIGSFHLGHEEPALSPKLPIVIDDSEAAAELRQRRRKRSSSRSKEMPGDGKALQAQRPSSTVAEAAPPLLPTIVRRGLSGIFYVGVAVALLALYGKMSNPEWEPLSAAKQPMAELQQKVIDMELQNNLMRAEIDILSRQVNYLSNAKHQMPPPTPGQQPSREERPRGKGGKHFKAWPGNGERLEPVDIDKDDLKRPYKCADGHIEIAGMCVEDRPDSFVNTVEEVLDTLQGNTAAEDSDLDPAKRMKPDSRKPEPAQFDAPPPPPPPPQPQQPEESRQRFGEQKYQKDFKPHNSREQYQKQRPNSKERFGKENRYPKNGGSGDGGLSKEQFRKRFKADEAKNASPESGERFKRESHEKRRGGGDSKEQWRKHPKGSGEHHHQARGSGEWHEKLMQQRENSRRQHEQKRNDKNWYIERGAGREHMRYS